MDRPFRVSVNGADLGDYMMDDSGRFHRPKTTYITGSGQVIGNVHAQDVCAGQWCVIHNPMPGPWSAWPTHWRDDRGIMERLCPHGIGHPAPEDVWFAMRRGDDSAGVHGCDGCCRMPNPAVIDGEVVEVREVRELPGGES